MNFSLEFLLPLTGAGLVLVTTFFIEMAVINWLLGILVLAIVFVLPVIFVWRVERREREFRRSYWSKEVDRVLGRDDG